MKSKRGRLKQKEISLSKCILIWVLFSVFLVIVLHYTVLLLYKIGDAYIGFPTFLDQEKMLTYITTVLSVLSTTTLSVIAVYQTYRVNETQNYPTIVISNGNSLFLEFDSSKADRIDCCCVGCKRDRSSFNLLFTILDKSIRNLCIDNFTILSKDNEQVASFPVINLPGLESTIGLLPANKRFFVCYGTDEIESGFTGTASFRIKCQTISGGSYQKNWEVYFTLSKSREITIHDIFDGYWEKAKM